MSVTVPVLSRRQVLAAGASLTVAGSGGCVMNRGGGSETVLGFVAVERSDVSELAVVESDDWTAAQRRLLGDDPGNNATAYGYRPFDEGDVVLANGTYYTVSVAENGSETVTRPVLHAEPVSDPDGAVADPSSLPDADVMALKCAVASVDGKGPEPCVVHGGEGSAFWPVPVPEYVDVGGDVYRLSASEESVGLQRYDYEFEAVAESLSAFADYAVEHLLAVDFDALSLTERQQEILRTAAEEGSYRETPPYSDALHWIVETFRAGADGQEGYVRFDGAFYLATVSQIWAD